MKPRNATREERGGVVPVSAVIVNPRSAVSDRAAQQRRRSRLWGRYRQGYKPTAAGAATLERHGREHFREMARKSAIARAAKAKATRESELWDQHLLLREDQVRALRAAANKTSVSLSSYLRTMIDVFLAQ